MIGANHTRKEQHRRELDAQQVGSEERDADLSSV